jgi:hypothetical protein
LALAKNPWTAGIGLFALAFTLFVSTNSEAQTLSTGGIQGRVVDTSGMAVGNAVVTVRDRLTGQTRTEVLDRGGEFRFQFLPPGSVDLTVEAFGFQPARIERIAIVGARTTSVTATLSRSEDPNVPPAVRQFSGAGMSTLTTLSTDLIEAFPTVSRDAATLARFTAFAADGLETEGLPGYLSGIRTDGVPAGASSIYGFRPMSPLALSGVRAAEFATSADVELSGMAAPALSVHFLNSTTSLQFKGFADYTKGTSSSGELVAEDFSGIRGAALVSGPLVRDTSGYVFGAEFWRNEIPVAFADRIVAAATRAQAAAAQRGVTDFALPVIAEENAMSFFGRVNWRFGNRHTLTVSGAFTALPESEWASTTRSEPGLAPLAEGKDGLVSLLVLSRFSPTLGQDLQLSWDRTVRDYNPSPGTLRSSATLLTDNEISLGRPLSTDGRFDANTLRLRETLHFWNGAHHLKVGGSVEYASHTQTHLPQRSATFWYTSEAELTSGVGYTVQTSGLAEADFALGRAGLYLQDEWAVNDRLRVLVGARWDIDLPPVDDIVVDDEFLALSGLGADTALTRRGRISPRLEFEWRPDADGVTTIRGTAGVWSASMDPVLVGEILSNHGNVTVAREFGTFNQWPQPALQSDAHALTLAATAFQGARSKRAMLEISRRISPSVQLDLAGTYRYTDLLPTRSDINLISSAGARDQYGRPIFGQLQKSGGIVAATAETNRRFPGYDVVSAINVNGNSTYVGASAAVQANVNEAVTLHGSYTFSKTDDNWFMAREGSLASAVSPFPDENWTEGRSDFDVPHRAAVGAEFAFHALGGVRLAAFYRYRSGYPFTPGFRSGVDANGDGSARNDPAFIDENVAGFTDATSDWSCVRTDAGAFAERNSCREPSLSTLDARIAIGLLSSQNRTAEIVVDGINLLSSGAEQLDHALYLVDPARELSTTTAGVVTVPLIVNPEFGKPIYRSAAERALRVGVRVRF